MNLTENEIYEYLGKVENVNKGIHFANATIVTEDGEHINIKLDFDQVAVIGQGKIYQFKAKAVMKLEDELVLKCVEMTPAEDVLDAETLSHVLNHFYVYAPKSLMDIKQSIETFLEHIKSPVLKSITKTIYDERKKRFYLHPAATKFHHAYVGGLAYHTLTMLSLIDNFIDVYPFLNRDLLYAGTILHDMSKLDEISGVEGEYTKEGLLIGHLVMQTIIIDKVAEQLGFGDKEEVLMLKHMILSHHGQFHYGSPKKPQTGEALLLWYIDTIDSKLTVLGEVLEDTPEGSFTSMVSVLDRMRYYKAKKD